eukprot:gnl/MRDRNA2_/MRDRNA2_99474_c0_seq1.p1 gnl/MRDRNA2_/MRDRNA2_99474_c0~~gnl/MRDRNA2_/MRDRNA2_99474_c0_seq1.p1  ORF type:complete len:714 (-),score=179.47 gnl/MRDRNA2_/MRDRNA2_99474_c0_seq1:13-2154(-)
MAPVSEFETYLDSDKFKKLTEEYDRLWLIDDPEENPYKSKYEGRKLIEAAVEELKKKRDDHKDDQKAFYRAEELIARLLLYLGKNYYFCEECSTGEKHFSMALEKFLRLPHRMELKSFSMIQDCLNQLGMVWANRHGFDHAFNYLRRGQIMYLNRPAELQNEKALDNSYTLTLFHLAQAYGGMSKSELSAKFCAETMERQLHYSATADEEMRKKDPFDPKDWIRNCCSLSDYFINDCMFWTAEYVMHTALVMCERCGLLCGFEPENMKELTAEVQRDLGIMYSCRMKFSKSYVEDPDVCHEVWKGGKKKKEKGEGEAKGSKLEFKASTDGCSKGKTDGVVWDDVFPEVVFLEDAENADLKFAEETIAAGETSNDGKCSLLHLSNGEIVQLPLHFEATHKEVERRIQILNKAFLEVHDGPAPKTASVVIERIKNEEETGTGKDPSIPSCVAQPFVAARELFKLANNFLVTSLDFFVLDGWVTEHVKVLQELSQVYRTLCFWEEDNSRLCAMVRRRVRMQAPLLEQLNPTVYVAFWRQLSFEVGELYQELYEFKAHGKRPGEYRGLDLDDDSDDEDNKENDKDAANKKPKMSKQKAAKVNLLSDQAIECYNKFVDSYLHHGKLPDKIDNDNCRVYLTARMNRARMRTKNVGLSIDQQVENNKLALREYEWILDYAERNPETITHDEIRMAKEIALCQEMVGMLPSKLSRLASRRR